MSGLFLWFVYFTLEAAYKVRVVFIVVLGRTTGQYTFFCNLHYLFYLANKIAYLFLQLYSIGTPTENSSGFFFDEHLMLLDFWVGQFYWCQQKCEKRRGGIRVIKIHDRTDKINILYFCAPRKFFYRESDVKQKKQRLLYYSWNVIHIEGLVQ